jgi:acylphosphatase
MKINKRIQIKGKVQGVFFRKSTQEKALQLGITGWVQNEPDGSVLTEIEGTAEAIAQMEQWLHQGPERARVEEVMIVEGEVKGYEDFQVKR